MATQNARRAEHARGTGDLRLTIVIGPRATFGHSGWWCLVEGEPGCRDVAAAVFTTGDAAVELQRLGTRPRHSTHWTHWNLRQLLVDGRGLSGQWPWKRSGRLGRDESDEVLVSIPPVLEQAEHDELLAVLATISTQPEKWRSYLLRGLIVSPHGKAHAGHRGTPQPAVVPVPPSDMAKVAVASLR